MAGIYVHIPFCRSKCDYCDFFSMPLATACRHGRDIFERYVAAVVSELRIRASELTEPVKTVYIGGGTPTALPSDLLIRLIDSILSADIGSLEIRPREVTVEGNPEDITYENLQRLKEVGVNRISIGIQSFDPEELRKVGRHHQWYEGAKALDVLAKDGINYNADLIYGLPGQTLDSWSRQLNSLLDYNPPHVSAYLLSFEPATKLYVRRDKGEVTEADEKTAVDMYTVLCQEMNKHGYEHYEISNFAKPGCFSRHNSSYWKLTPYLGLGCSAHSFDGVDRRFNPSNLKEYIQNIERGEVAAIIDEEDSSDRINDYIITSLRTASGMDLALIERKWGSGVKKTILSQANGLIGDGRLILTGNQLVIPEAEWLTADSVMREMLLD